MADQRYKRLVWAWLATGPLGHLAAGVLDWIELVARWASGSIER
jgi:hypothetical protein